jgi:hypothetical protein
MTEFVGFKVTAMKGRTAHASQYFLGKFAQFASPSLSRTIGHSRKGRRVHPDLSLGLDGSVVEMDLRVLI